MNSAQTRAVLALLAAAEAVYAPALDKGNEEDTNLRDTWKRPETLKRAAVKVKKVMGEE